ncbi:hypothetical protein [Staphylococcus capitis]|uniref:hypothetical protein n=1 Tax=Staphylococcus capitis TaxID=29388 RepID=UPI002DB99A99|nr:hypothetical protein [Staphylococcus capitis]MEB5628944.1 hypothetical protein [Staphylococcus capitis]
MTQPTKEELLEFIRNNNKLDVDGAYPRSDWWRFKQERDNFKKQRDELIKDMAEVKRKAEAWDKLKEYVLDRNEAFSDRKGCAQSPQQFEYFENLLTAFKVIKTKMKDLEADY